MTTGHQNGGMPKDIRATREMSVGTVKQIELEAMKIVTTSKEDLKKLEAAEEEASKIPVRGNSEAREISERAGELYNQISLLAERLQKLGGSLAAANNHYNNTVTALVGNQGLYGKVERFKTLSAKVTKTLPEVELLQSNIETDRLVVLVENDLEK